MGDRLIERVTVVFSLLVFGFPLAGVLLIFPWGTPSVGDVDGFTLPSFVIGPGALTATFGGIVLAFVALWYLLIYPTLVICLRFGRYSSEEPRLAGLPVVRGFLVASAVVLAITLTFLVLYSGVSALGIAPLSSVAVLIALWLFSRAGDRLTGRTWRTAIVSSCLVAGLVTAFAGTLAVYTVANFPKQAAFEDRLSLSTAPKAEVDAWQRVVQLLPVSNRDEQMTNPDRERALDFLADNVMSVPEEVYFNPHTPVPQVTRLPALVDSELSEIKELLTKGDVDSAREKYLRLWNVADKLLSSHGTLIQALVAMGLVHKLTEFHLEGDHRTGLHADRQVLDISARMASRLDEVLAQTFRGEYRYIKFGLIGNPKETCAIDRDSVTGLCLLYLPWPFYDETATLKAHHDWQVKLVDLSEQPAYRIRDELDAHRAESRKLYRRAAFKDPVGSLVLSIAAAPSFTRFVISKEEAKSKIAAFRFLLQHVEGAGDATVDPLSGVPYVVADRGDRLEVSSSYVSGGEPRFTLTATKP